jgi:hypothetical protein
VCKRLDHAPAHGGQRLAAGGRPERVALAPALGLVGQGGLDFGEGLALERAEAALAQALVGDQRRTGRFGYGACGFPGP